MVRPVRRERGPRSGVRTDHLLMLVGADACAPRRAFRPLIPGDWNVAEGLFAPSGLVSDRDRQHLAAVSFSGRRTPPASARGTLAGR
jgi:hypothetical protein